ncbi:MAG: AAA family ATPase [Phycisphaerales bacterium]|nr:AAA family ATPase [Phycisphaerales bacterium]
MNEQPPQSPLAMPNRNLGPATDLWQTQLDLSGQPQAQQQQQQQPLRKLHRLLRGRYLVALGLALVCAVGGGLAGYMSQKPRFQSRGYIEIKPFLSSIGEAPVVMPMYQAYMETQVTRLQDQRVIQRAMSSDKWRSLGRGMSDAEFRAFIENLMVQHVKSSSLIMVSYTDENPQAAMVAVETVIRAYLDTFEDVDGRERRDRLAYLDNERNRLIREKNSNQDQILALSEQDGTPENVAVFHSAAVQELVRIMSQLTEAQIKLGMAESTMDQAPRNTAATTNPSALTAEQIATVDPTMAQMIATRRDLDFKLQSMRKTLGDRHRVVIEMTGRLEFQDQQISRYAEMYRKRYGNQLGTMAQGAEASVGPVALDELKRNIEYLQKMYDKQLKLVTEIGERAAKIQKLKLEVDQADQNLAENSKKMEKERAQQALEGRLNVLSYGDRPVSPSQDKRKQASALGFVGGGAVPIVLLLLVGLMDQRYRYSDEPTSDVSGVPLLGILPNLPDLLTDPEQAAIAAHCVHQIRTMLQLGSHVEERRVFAVTSASPGDGKTSLTLALGLSFAASGSRTLLIDCDLVGGGLTHRLNVKSPEGILEALAHRSLLDYIHNTEIADLAILPVGGAHAHHASSLSPSALRRLIGEARKHYDTILIDSGPILGSIEASPVAANADGVILAVSRGQQRPLVEKALAQLTAIRATIAGVVFNRAQAKDFDRSVSRMSMRSMSRNATAEASALVKSGKPANGARNGMGPVAHAVAKSFNPANGDDHG